ncbi:SDR family oxidoreductase [Zhongshania sp.]|jgi:NAD(P)-dependent dehydrogenase (short-subunit alcohol dehydrogenase family)|uniref:SDR family oxidoreductase n=1 Tax=Zhongshania sp. TaxID=1971902 RepID=UPI001B7A4281|nr:SDR family NAD(P)-dependent oxidoreductase [Zhongshania sp.]MBQ0796882.1 SDR family NAD(P)-dependent oxidoreductase [Zhongshania sp.]
MSLEMTGRTAVITGAASGIGKALAIAAAKRGMNLALADNNADALGLMVDELGDQVSVISAVVDVRKRSDLTAFADSVKGQSIALVFANAGVMRAGTSWELSEEDWDVVFDVNVKGAMNTVSAFMPHLLKQELRSRVVFTGSISAFMASENLSCYSSSKHALWGIAEAMQLELTAKKAPVDVSFLAPSGVKTSLASAPLSGACAESQKEIDGLLAAFGVPAEEIAEKTFSDLQENKFWIFPQPEFKPVMLARVQNISEERQPIK